MILNNPHLIVFMAVQDDESENSVTSYVRFFFESHVNSGLTAEDIPGIQDISLISLPLVDREAKIRELPNDVVKQLKSQEDCLLRSITREWHIPPGEKLIKSTVGVISEAFGECPLGTVVVIRETDKATVAYLFPHLLVDIETGAVRQVDTPFLEFVFQRPVTPPTIALEAMALGSMDGAHIALETASTLAFALPEPFGVIGAALFSLVNALLPQEKSHLIEDIVSALDQYMKHRDLNNWVQDSKALMQWCNEQLSQIRQQEPTTTQIKDTLLPNLEKNLSPGGESMYNHLVKIMSQEYIKEPESLNILLVCVSSYLFSMKFKLMLEAFIASKYSEKQDNNIELFNEWNQRWRYDYLGFKNEILGDKKAGIQGWAAKVEPVIDNRITERLGKVTPVMRKDFIGIGMCTGGPAPNCQTTHSYSWVFCDMEKGDRDWMNHSFPDTEPKNKHDEPIQHKAEAEQARKTYIETLANELDKTYGDAKKTVGKWVDSINEWNEHLPPGKPKGTPKIEPNGWQGQASGDSPWNKHKAVRYAIEFYNDKGPGLLSDWSNSYEINGKSQPTLTEIPLDETLMAKGRRIYRRFDSDPAERIGLIPDNTTTTYVDIK
jgi:hypothetical protein